MGFSDQEFDQLDQLASILHRGVARIERDLGTPDPYLAVIATCTELHHSLDELERQMVIGARNHGKPWELIATGFGKTRQTIQKRFASLAGGT